VHIYPIEVRRPTRFLVCSDGLTDCLALDQIEETVNVGNDLLETVNRLYQAAHNAGCRDNITILWLEISDEEGVMND
jgi:serine/threonine protein phosphatase PrpC